MDTKTTEEYKAGMAAKNRLKEIHRTLNDLKKTVGVRLSEAEEVQRVTIEDAQKAFAESEKRLKAEFEKAVAELVQPEHDRAHLALQGAKAGLTQRLREVHKLTAIHRASEWYPYRDVAFECEDGCHKLDGEGKAHELTWRGDYTEHDQKVIAEGKPHLVTRAILFRLEEVEQRHAEILADQMLGLG
jgi:hypothetical protein